MSRIAVKIFLAFWLTFFLAVTGFAILLEALRQQDGLQPLGVFQQRQLDQHHGQLQTIYRNRGWQGLRRFSQDVETNRGVTIFLLDANGKDMLDRVTYQHHFVPVPVLHYQSGCSCRL